MDCRTPMGIPQTNLMKSKKPTLGRKQTLRTAPIFWKNPVAFCWPCVLSIIFFSLFFGMWGMKAMTRITLSSDPEAANSEAVCSLKTKSNWRTKHCNQAYTCLTWIVTWRNRPKLVQQSCQCHKKIQVWTKHWHAQILQTSTWQAFVNLAWCASQPREFARGTTWTNCQRYPYKSSSK